jgi:hypothetical protein
MKNTFLILLIGLLAPAALRAGICYSLANSGSTLIVSVVPNSNYNTSPINRWVTGNVTLSWDQSLGGNVVYSTAGQNGFTFAADGPASLNGSTYYQKFGFAFGTPYLFNLTSGTSVEVLRIVVSHPSILAGNFSIVPSPPNPPANGFASFQHALGEQYTNTGCSLTATSVPLPVQLTAFDARPLESSILLTWQSVLEQQFAGYELERSTDAASFDKIVWVAAKGRGAGQFDYQHDDKKVAPGVLYYYRLKMLDTDGNFRYSPLRLAQLPVKNGLAVYPNPVANRLRLDWGKLEPTHLAVVDVNGRVVLDRPDISAAVGELDVAALPAGMYFLQVRTGPSERLTTIQFVKQ